MEKSTAETIVKVYAVLFWVVAFFVALGALGLLFFSSFLGGMMGGAFTMMGPALTDEMMGEAFAGTALVGLGMIIAILVLAAVIAAYALVGRGLWRHESWARIGALVISILTVFSFPVGTIVGGLGIWLFGFEPSVKNLFGKVAAPVKAKKKKR